jgi:hypothetical protein
VFTFNTATGQILIPACEVAPAHGGQVRVTGFMSLDPTAEHDPSAIQVDFNGSGLDITSVGPYLGNKKIAAFMKEEAGRLRVLGHMAGSHSAPVTRFNIESQDTSGQCLVLLTRERAAVRLQAPALDVSATALTQFPPYEVQKAVITQDEAIAMREPEYMGGSVVADVRHVDIVPLLRVMQEATGTEVGSAGGVEERAEVNGHVKLVVHQFDEAGEAPFHHVGQGLRMGGAGEEEEVRQGFGLGRRDLVGKLEVKAARVNQLHLVNGLDGNLTMTGGRLKLDAKGKYARERLHIDADVDAFLLALQGDMSAAGGVDEEVRGDSVLSFRHGGMRIDARASADLHHVRLLAPVLAAAVHGGLLPPFLAHLMQHLPLPTATPEAACRSTCAWRTSLWTTLASRMCAAASPPFTPRPTCRSRPRQCISTSRLPSSVASRATSCTPRRSSTTVLCACATHS